MVHHPSMLVSHLKRDIRAFRAAEPQRQAAKPAAAAATAKPPSTSKHRAQAPKQQTLKQSLLKQMMVGKSGSADTKPGKAAAAAPLLKSPAGRLGAAAKPAKVSPAKAATAKGSAAMAADATAAASAEVAAAPDAAAAADDAATPVADDVAAAAAAKAAAPKLVPVRLPLQLYTDHVRPCTINLHAGNRFDSLRRTVVLHCAGRCGGGGAGHDPGQADADQDDRGAGVAGRWRHRPDRRFR